MKQLLRAIIRLYQRTLSPDHGPLRALFPDGYCRFSPSCSEYALGAIESHGALRGSTLALKRLGRCHPWSAGGLDPVPSEKAEVGPRPRGAVVEARAVRMTRIERVTVAEVRTGTSEDEVSRSGAGASRAANWGRGPTQ